MFYRNIQIEVNEEWLLALTERIAKTNDRSEEIR
jgi:hypothetical protein